MDELKGWLLDLYADPQGGVVLWLLGEDGARHRLTQDFPVTFYAAGAAERLRELWKYLEAQYIPLRLSRTHRRDLFQPAPLTLLAVEAPGPLAQEELFNRQLQGAFPDLTYYDADVPLPLRHAAAYGTFPLCFCRLRVGVGGRVEALQVEDSPWELDVPSPPLRLLSIDPDRAPRHGAPSALLVRYGRRECRLSLEPARALLANLASILHRYDPDLLLTAWGDSWMLPRLFELSSKCAVPLSLSRDAERDFSCRSERTYFSYGQVIHRDQQVHLYGRCHIDIYNAMLFHDYGLDGVFELARVTGLSLQTVARVSPGSGISAMQMVTAMRHGVLVPWHKQQSEQPKTALDLMRSDMGGMVYQPIIGLHRDVAELDFISMYPSIMVRCNISPETQARDLPALGDASADEEPPGLIPLTLQPLLEKRLELKRRLAERPRWDPRRRAYKAQASAHKWLLVTCFGYLGYKNARFGRIEAHEAVTANGREALLRSKEAAEDMGFKVLHLFVDGVWVWKKGADKVQDYQALLEEITDRTGLPIALDGIYKWIAFLPSRMNSRVPVPTRYFGVFQDGSIKVRGIEARRHDTPYWIAWTQMEIIKLLAAEPAPEGLPTCLPGVIRFLRRQLAELRGHRVPLEKLLVSQKLSREISEYKSPSPAARAAAQLENVGKHIRPGQMVRFLYTLGDPGVYAWDLPQAPNPLWVDVPRYRELLLRAVATVLQPFGVDEVELPLKLALSPKSRMISLLPELSSA